MLSALDLTPNDDAKLVDHPTHPSAESLADLNRLLARDLHRPWVYACTNCTGPRTGGKQGPCEWCGHDAANDAELLGHSPPGSIPPAVREALAEARSATATHGTSRVAVVDVDERQMLHHTSLPPYPERPERVQAVLARLASCGLLQRCGPVLPAREAADQELQRVHSPHMVAALTCASSTCSSADGGHAAGDPDVGCVPNPYTSDLLRVLDPAMLAGPHADAAARLAAAAVSDLAVAVASGRADHGVAVVRPPGHHATRDRAQGGSYYNSVAVAARAAQATGAVRRVMIVDWDIHRGQGTQNIFAGDESVLCVSLHREDGEFYPVASIDEAGQEHSSSINISWASGGISDGDYVSGFLQVVMPVAYSYAPDLILVSAGFAAAERDFQGGCSVSPSCYAHLTHMLKGVAPVVLALEGGYNLDMTARCTEACVRVLLGERPSPLPKKLDTTREGWVGVMNALQVHGESWPALHALSWNGWMDVIKQQQEAGEDEDAQEGEGSEAAGEREEFEVPDQA